MNFSWSLSCVGDDEKKIFEIDIVCELDFVFLRARLTFS